MKLDEFESVFRSSVKTQYHYQAPKLESVLLVTDVPDSETQSLLHATQTFLSHVHGGEMEWFTMCGDDFSEVSEVLDRVRRNPPSLVVCYRHLLGQGAKLPYSLGSTVDTLTQATDTPVLLLPRPKDGSISLPDSTDRVLVVTDHLTGDDHLVSWAAHLCADDGTLFLTHIENQRELERYLDVISKIPGIDGELAREKIPQKLLTLPSDYIESTKAALQEHGLHETVESIVRLGTPVKEYEQIAEELNIDLLVMNTKDEGQSAMQALAYALSVEIRQRPLLLL